MLPREAAESPSLGVLKRYVEVALRDLVWLWTGVHAGLSDLKGVLQLKCSDSMKF